MNILASFVVGAAFVAAFIILVWGMEVLGTAIDRHLSLRGSPSIIMLALVFFLATATALGNQIAKALKVLP